MLTNLINLSNNIVIFTGAGVSTLSGIPDFRSYDNFKEFGDPTKFSSINFLKENPDEFYRIFQKRLNMMKFRKPNKIHEWINELENTGKLSMLITQNIDNLHRNKNKIELHGNAFEYYCTKCNKKYNNYDNLICKCGGVIRPNIVLFGEKLNVDSLRIARERISNSDLFIVIGTSLLVSPANMLCTLTNKGKKVLINRDTTPLDYCFDIIIHKDLENEF